MHTQGKALQHFLPLHAVIKIIYMYRKTTPGKNSREQTKGQPVSAIQIVYYTKSDLIIVVMGAKIGNNLIEQKNLYINSY